MGALEEHFTCQGRLDREQGVRLLSFVQGSAPAGVVVRLDRLHGFDDHGLAGLLRAADQALRDGRTLRLEGAGEELAGALRALALPAPAPARPAPLERLGRGVLPFVGGARVQLGLAGRALVELAGTLRGRGPRLDRLLAELVRAGLDALPVICLVTALIGIVLAFQSAAQLRQFGATIYIADLVTVSVTREIGPLLVGLVLAGRTGSANTAEIGAMVVSEELEALKQMGIDRGHYLLVPKILALALALPCLAAIGSAISILCAAIVSAARFDIGVATFFREARTALESSDLTTGLAKSFVFGLIVGVISCSHGLAVEGGATAVGRRTTAAVVVSIFYIIVADTAFTWVFHGS